ncbi:MAG: bifunctional 5,10-methylene-tetrahydrofolate dehydrogenase/5,10-methylene-tetrahydrofolate cyclohydrolase [Lachnospiraceae bacterium]|nr:bifunctional 5,10-methylene-tetrahydrofolate dehydrogenase/5,10-methylene-tetrahydrofolate cyclohydrolase [Lachnospiraceae bacterium]
MAEILKGAPVAAAISEKLKEKCAGLKSEGVFPTLAIVRAGERPDDLAYERAAIKRMEGIGIAVRQFVVPTDGSCENDYRKQLPEMIKEINLDPDIHGCLLFRPLPDKELEKQICKLLLPEKDMDCMTDGSLAGVFSGSGVGYPPCTAQAVIELCDHYGIELAGKNIAVIGRSLVIGRPVAMLLMQRNATVTICHTRTRNMPEICRNSDIIVAAAGSAHLVTAEYVHEGQIIIDVGINVAEDGTMSGDVDAASVDSIVSKLTPVPGGVGSVTTAVLARHVIEAAGLLLSRKE